MSYKDTLFDLPEHSKTSIQEKNTSAKPRLKNPVRDQVDFLPKCIDDLIPDDHKVRSVWAFVELLDLSSILGKIKAVESSPGAPAIDPKILLSLWLYAFIEGIISAKMINRYCKEHLAFKWLCGGVSVNEHTISDFRTAHGEALDELLTQSIGILSHEGMITITRVAQDGMKVEANAGKTSFRREKTLKEHLVLAEAHVKALKEEFKSNPGAMSAKKAAAKKRAAEEQVKRTKHAIDELRKLRKQKEDGRVKNRKPFTEKEKNEVRASKTDPEARIMKMANSGFAPAYNVQLASDTKSKAIVGVTVVQSGHDYGQLSAMKKQVEERLGHSIDEILADPGFLQHDDVDDVSTTSKVYMPTETLKESNKYKSLNELKKRMETDEAKEIYKERASTAEFVNARVRTRGFTQVLVSGLNKVQVLATLFALGQNMLVWLSKQ